ncbi:MAG: outer membrane beta-barrel protein [Sphingobacterium sp.]
MRNICSIVFFILLILTSLGDLFGQGRGRDVEGLVVDTTGMGMSGASVRMVSAVDTMSTTTDDNGFYRFRNIKGKHLNISFSMLGYDIANQTVSTSSFFSNIFVPKVTLSPQSTLIPEVRVLKIVPVVEKGDTVQFNMGAFSFREHSLLEEALKQLPGFQILRDGTTYYNGQAIQGVRVDGQKFFGGDLLTATRNLPAEFVKQIEVVNDYGDASMAKGIKSTEPEKIINIVLEENKKKIAFGQGTLGAGTHDRFIGSLGINKFNDGQELSVVGSINNTNTSLFLFGSPDGAGNRLTDLSEIGDFSDQTDGLNKLSSLGITFSDQVGEHVSINGGYNYQSKTNVTDGTSLMTSSYLDYRINRNEEYQSETIDNLHRFNLEMNAKFKNRDILKIAPTLTYSRFYLHNQRSTELRNLNIREMGNRQDTSINNTPTAVVSVLYSKYFEKPGRKLVGDLLYNYRSSRKDEVVWEDYIRFDSTGTSPIMSQYGQNQLVDAKNDVATLKASLSYVEPFFEHSLLEISHDMDITQIEAVRRVRDPFSVGLGLVDSLALDYGYQFRSFQTGLNYQYEPNNQFRVNMGFSVQPVYLNGQVRGDSASHQYDNVNLVPTTTVRYKFENDLEVRFSYLGRNVQPSFLHIAPVRDNSNSRNIIVGNPALKAEFLNKFSTTLRKFVASRGQYFQTDFAYTFTSNKIVSSKSSLSNETIQETTFENTDGYYDLKWFYQFNSPIFVDDLLLNLTGNVDYYNNLSYVNSVKSRTQQLLFNQNLQFRYNWSEYFESVFNTNYFLNRAVYQLPRRSKIAAHSFLFSLAGRGYINDRLMIGAEMSQKFYQGYVSELSSVNPTIINAYLEFSFLRNKSALIRLQCNDLMDQNKNVGILTEYIGNDVFESRNNRLGRYFMLTLNLRLQSYPGN